MAKVDRIVKLLPAFFGATENYKLLFEVFKQLSQPLEEADAHIFRIQRAHRLRVAEHIEDIIRLAALLNLTAFHFEDILVDKTLPYKEKLALMRARVERVAQIHLNGLGTPWAVMQCAAIFLNATIVPDKQGDPLIKHLDLEGFFHRATIEFTHIKDKPRERFYLYENPFQRKKVEQAERWPPTSWAVQNDSAAPAPLRFVIKGTGERTILPSLYCPETQEGIFFNGIVPDGATLVVDAQGATLEGKAVDEWLIHNQGGAFGFSRQDNAKYANASTNLDPFDGNIAGIMARPYRKSITLPEAPKGKSKWHLNVNEGRYDGDAFDYSVMALPHQPIGIYDGSETFDACVFHYPASASVGMAWDERVACAFKLMLPKTIPQNDLDDKENGASQPKAASAQELNFVSRIDSILPRFRAAGVRSFVDTSQEVWIIGESVLRNQDVSEDSDEGLNFHVTSLHNEKTDVLVALD